MFYIFLISTVTGTAFNIVNNVFENMIKRVLSNSVLFFISVSFGEESIEFCSAV